MFTRQPQCLILSALSLSVFVALTLGCGGLGAPVGVATEPAPPGDNDAYQSSDNGYFICFWNCENFFDDKNNEYHTHPDKEYDEWFADHPEVSKQKVHNLSKALIEMNDGKGPDILALAEVESTRAAELLVEALNAKLKDPELHYKHILMKEPKGFGRNIATAIITRLPVIANKTQLHGKRQRILEGHVEVNGHDLVILATHWTSRVSDQEGDSRDRYADQIYGVYKGMYLNNPKVDFLVCGDFNDPPEDDSVVKHLHGIGDLERVKKEGDEPLLFNLSTLYLKNKEGTEGTHFFNGKLYNSKWAIFDQILVSPAMLNKGGWSCDPKSAKIINDLTADKHGRPLRFGDKNDKTDLEHRGYSYHFPVSVRLYVTGK